MSAVPDMAGGLRQAAALALNAVLPPRCLHCGAMVDTPHSLCPSCWERVDFIAPPYCRVCGRPFEFDPGEENPCGACAKEMPPFDRARSIFRYDDVSRALVLAFKHGDRTDAAPALGRWLVRTGAEIVDQADMIVPVPLHWTRLFRRRYNQAALLAAALGRFSGVPTEPDLLVRRRRTRSQGRLSPAGRIRNVRGAFAIRRGRREAVRGRRILLVDDVLTTGATVAECARVLRRGGAAGVDVLTAARVVRGAY